MNLYNDIAVMVKTVSPTLVPSNDLQLYMVYVALVITVSPICLELWNMVSFLLDSDLVCHVIGDNCIANKSWTLRACLTRLIIIAGDNCVANKCCIYGLFLLFVILDLLRIMRTVVPFCFLAIYGWSMDELSFAFGDNCIAKYGD